MEELSRSRVAQRTVDKSMWTVISVFGEWRSHSNRCSVEESNSKLVYINSYFCIVKTFSYYVESLDIYLSFS